MSSIPKVVEKRLKAEVPKFQKVLKAAQSRDINEADTVVIITDMLEKVFGLDKYEDVTREFATQGTYIDLAVRTKNKIDYLIEVKAIGISLKDNHLRQAVGYASSEGVRWAILTNGVDWQIHKITVDGTVTSETIAAFNFLEISTRSNADLEMLFLLCKRAVAKDVIEEYYQQKAACNRYSLGAILQSDDVIKMVKRTLKKISGVSKVDDDELRSIIRNEVIKREVSESEPGIAALKSLNKALKKASRAKAKKPTVVKETTPPVTTDKPDILA